MINLKLEIHAYIACLTTNTALIPPLANYGEGATDHGVLDQAPAVGACCPAKIVVPETTLECHHHPASLAIQARMLERGAGCCFSSCAVVLQIKITLLQLLIFSASLNSFHLLIKILIRSDLKYS